MKYRLVLASLLLAPASASGQGDSEQERLDALCSQNPDSTICAARAQGKGASSDLAARVKVGEGWRTSPVTSGEITNCWATWTALREHIARKGRGTFPADYTLANIDKRIADWAKAMDVAFQASPEYRASTSEQKLALAREEVAGPRIVVRAEWSGNCKTLPR